jgi:hypothetical protein
MAYLKTLALLAAPGLALGLAASANAVTEKTCKVAVDRSQSAGTFNVQRQQLDNGNCVCYVYTGPKSQSAATERSIAAIQKSGACTDAPAVAIAQDGEEGGEGGDGSGTGALLLLGAAAGTALIVAASSGGSDSP